MKLSQPRNIIGLILALILIPTNMNSASAALVASSNTDAEGICTQSVDVITGVEVYRYGNECVVIFKNIGITTWQVPAGVTKIATLIVAGGGGGGYDVSGGGGAGGLLYYGGENPKTPNGETLTVTSGNVSVSVGDGGNGASASMVSTAGANGSNSYITLPSAQTYTALGGGGGNSRNRTSTAASGGSGGGGGYGNGTPTDGGAGTGSGVTRQGYAGGRIQTGNYGGGGGGGAGVVGFNWIDSDANAGSGGAGLQYSISGGATFYAGGGGGGSWAAKGGAGGNGGGGAGGSVDSSNCRANCSSSSAVIRTGVSGTVNTGGGGGGSGNADGGSPGGKGGSGIVIIRYALNLTSTFNSLTLPGGVATATFRTPVSVTANVSVASRISFFVNRKVLPGCKNRLTSGSGSSHSVTCIWKPSLRGNFAISAISTPTIPSISGASSAPVMVSIANRSGKR
jgi:hypothetical protein